MAKYDKNIETMKRCIYSKNDIPELREKLSDILENLGHKYDENEFDDELVTDDEDEYKN